MLIVNETSGRLLPKYNQELCFLWCCTSFELNWTVTSKICKTKKRNFPLWVLSPVLGSPVDEKCSKESRVSLIEPIEFRLQHIMHKKPSELVPINPEKRKPYVYLITTFCNGSLEVNTGGKQSSAHKLQEKKLQVGIWKIIFTVRAVRPWNRFLHRLWDSHLNTCLKLYWTRAWEMWSTSQTCFPQKIGPDDLQRSLLT